MQRYYLHYVLAEVPATVTPSAVATLAALPAAVPGADSLVEVDEIDLLAVVVAPTIQVVPGQVQARPDSDFSRGTWTTDSGGTTNLWDSLNETGALDTDYVKSAVDPTNNELIVTLTDVGDPVGSTGHVVSFRYRKA